MTELRIEPLTARHVAAGGALLAASHRDYPAFRAVFPDLRIRTRVLAPFQTAATRDAIRYGHAVGAFLDDRLVGVALWQPPGRFPLSPLRKARMAPALARAAIAARAAFGRFARSGAALERAFPDEPSWYLQALGVHPNAQRQGIGAALLTAGLELVDADHVACHLHTSDPANVEYYRRWGFSLTQPAFAAGAGGPTYYGMTRPASQRPDLGAGAPRSESI
jgi:ribosomal protein S18 acetylase RimI-like enzyme